MQLAGYAAAILIGLSLALIGGGGSILTVPVIVYLFGIPPLQATSYSLFIVGVSSLVGAITSYARGCVNIKTASLFGLSSISTVFITRKFIIPLIPSIFGTIGGFVIKESFITMVLFALLMLPAAFSMIRKKKPGNEQAIPGRAASPLLIVYGVVIGLVTGLLGAGGGFLLIPALVLLAGLPIKEAIGTSLLIIALNSLIGFAGDFGHFPVDWRFLLSITVIAITGIIAGGLLNKKIAGEKLKTGFGWFVLVIGACVLVKEIFFSR